MRKKFFQIQALRLLESINGDQWRVMIVEEGLSKNGKYYPGKVLQAASNLFENAKVMFYEFKSKHFDHLPDKIEEMRPEGFPKNTAGFLTDIKYESVNRDGESVSGLTGTLNISKGSTWLKDLLTSAWDKGVKKVLGLSINADGEQSLQLLSGRPVQLVNSIENVFSVDLVTHPAAGGGFLKLLSSYNEAERRSTDMFEKLIKIIQESRPELLGGVDVKNITEDQVSEIMGKLMKEADDLHQKAEEEKTVAEEDKKKAEDVADAAKEKEAAELDVAIEAATKAIDEFSAKESKLALAAKGKKMLEQVSTLVKNKSFPLATALLQKWVKESTPEKKKEDNKDPEAEKRVQEAEKRTKEAEKKNKDLETKVDDIIKTQKIAESRAVLSAQLDASNLPNPVREKLRKGFEGQIINETSIKESIRSEKDVLAALSKSGDIIDLGDGQTAEIRVGRTGSDRLQASLDLTFDHEPDEKEKADYEGVEPFESIREAYVAITGDTEVTGLLPRSKLKEAVTSSSFSYMLGYTINRRMLKEYKGLPHMWKEIAQKVSVKDFKMQELIRWGGFGVLPTVIAARTTQGTPTDTASPSYPELGYPVDTEQAYGIATKGGMLTITRRSIINDDLRQLKKVPQKLARSAEETLNQFAFDLMMDFTSASGINTGANWADEYAVAAGINLFDIYHQNYSTTALGYDSLQTLLNYCYYTIEDGDKTATADNTLTSDATTINVTGGTGTYIKAGDVIKIDGELIRVDVVATDVLTVTRGLFGTTAAAHDKSGDNYPVVTKSSRFLGLSKPKLWIPRTLKGLAEQLLLSTLHPESGENAVNVLKGAASLRVSPYLRGDENNYYLSFTDEVDPIEIGFLNGKEIPEILVQDQPTVGNVFTADTIRYKVRHEYGGCVPDYRAYAAGIV